MERLGKFVPFLIDRRKGRDIASARLQGLRLKLVLYVLETGAALGELGEAGVAWARGHAEQIPLIESDNTRDRLLDTLQLLESNPTALGFFSLLNQSGAPTTKMFPKLEHPKLDAKHLPRADLGRIDRIEGHLNAINAAGDDIRTNHDRTFDNTLSEQQQKAVLESIDLSYRTVSRQSRAAADIIASMQVL